MDDEPPSEKSTDQPTEEPLTAAEWDAFPPVLTAEQVARVVGVKPAQVLRWANAGTMPGLRIGRQWRFAKDSLTTPGPSEPSAPEPSAPGPSGSSGEQRPGPEGPSDGSGSR